MCLYLAQKPDVSVVQMRALEVFASLAVARDLCTTGATVSRPPGAPPSWSSTSHRMDSDS